MIIHHSRASILYHYRLHVRQAAMYGHASRRRDFGDSIVLPGLFLDVRRHDAAPARRAASKNALKR